MRTALAITARVTATLLTPICEVTADTVELVNGDVLSGTISERSDERIVLVHPVLGEMVISADQVSAFTIGDAAPQPEPAPAEAPAEPLPAPPKPELFGTGIMAGWDRSVEVGFNGSEGNTETFSLKAAFNAGYEDERDRWKLATTYWRSGDDGDVSENEFKALVIKDWLIPASAWFYFAVGQYEYDQFQAWEHRVSGFGGVGYEFDMRDDWDLRGRVGFGGNYEFGEVNEFTPEAFLGVETTYRINDRQSISFSNTYFADLEELSEFRNVTGVAWVVDIADDRHLKLKLGIDNEYESQVEAGFERNDLKYYGALLYDF